MGDISGINSGHGVDLSTVYNICVGNIVSKQSSPKSVDSIFSSFVHNGCDSKVLPISDYSLEGDNLGFWGF